MFSETNWLEIILIVVNHVYGIKRTLTFFLELQFINAWRNACVYRLEVCWLCVDLIWGERNAFILKIFRSRVIRSLLKASCSTDYTESRIMKNKPLKYVKHYNALNLRELEKLFKKPKDTFSCFCSTQFELFTALDPKEGI